VRAAISLSLFSCQEVLVLKSPRVRKRHRFRPGSTSNGLTDRERTTIVVALQFLNETWANELAAAAEEQRPPCLRSAGEVFEEQRLLSPTEIRELCHRLQSRVSTPAGGVPELVTFEIPCVNCNVPMRPQPPSVIGDNVGTTNTAAVLTCPQCGSTAEGCEPAIAANENPHKSPPRFQHP
jgi:hypothetical protein